MLQELTVIFSYMAGHRAAFIFVTHTLTGVHRRHSKHSYCHSIDISLSKIYV